jgi:hypothetical protein
MPNDSEFPNDGVVSTLSDVLEKWHPGLQRYCLSSKAAAGILRRATRRGRALPEPLNSALEQLAQEHLALEAAKEAAEQQPS